MEIHARHLAIKYMDEYNSFSQYPESTGKLLKLCAESAISLQRKNGSLPPTRQGIYGYNHTPVRNTAEWLLVFSKVYESLGEQRFRQAAIKAGKYLLSEEARPLNITFKSRNEPGKDLCDGLVGQAVPIEALSYAGKILHKSEFTQTALEVFRHHTFDQDLSLWEILEIDGERLSFDRTLNHQIIFAARSVILSSVNPEIESLLETFLDDLLNFAGVNPDGRFKHFVQVSVKQSITKMVKNHIHWPLLWNNLTQLYYDISISHSRKEVGYHFTILESLSRIKSAFPKHPVWSSKLIKKSMSFTNNYKYLSQLHNQKYEYGSPIPEFNHAIFLHNFTEGTSTKVSRWLGRGIERTLDIEDGLLTADTEREIQQASFVSRLIHIPNINVKYE